MKVALLKSGLTFRGGLEKYTRRLAAAFAQRGCEVTVLTSLRRNAEEAPTPDAELPYKVVCLGKQSWMGAKNRLDFDRQCRRWLKDNPQDVVFGMDRNTCQTHYRVGEGVHKAYLRIRRKSEGLFKRLTFAINPLHLVNLHLEKRTFCDPNLQAIITNSHMVKREVLTHYPVEPAKVHVVHNGVEWEEMSEDFEASLTLPPSDRHEFLFVGSGWRRKGLAPLLDALAALPRESFHLTVLGKENRQRSYRAQIKRLGLENNVTLEGMSSNVRAFMQRADTFVLPTRYDPFANVTVEALAMGLHVITTPYNGGKEVLDDTNGTVVDFPFLLGALNMRLTKRKTPESARRHRDSVRHLDFSTQLNQILDIALAGKPLLHTQSA